MKQCAHCGKGIEVGARTGRTETCPFCRADLHCCRNCRFYDPRLSKQCQEPGAELVREKTKANHCDFFTFAESSDAKESMNENTRRELDALFKVREKSSPE